MNARTVAVVFTAMIGWFGVSASAQDKARLGIVSASGCYFLNIAEVDGEKTLVADNICEYGLDEAWEVHLTELLSDSVKYEPVPVEMDREKMRAALHGDVSTDPFKPVFYTHKEHSEYLASVARENGVDALLITRAYGNLLSNGW